MYYCVLKREKGIKEMSRFVPIIKSEYISYEGEEKRAGKLHKKNEEMMLLEKGKKRRI